MDVTTGLYVALLLAGLLLVGIEIFIPGGIVGALGGLCLVSAIVLGFFLFDPPYNLISAAGILVASLAGLYIWATFVPRTRAGRTLTLERDGSDFRLADKDPDVLMGKEGTAQSTLRPSGVAVIDGRRRDVVAEDGMWIDAGQRIRVVSARGARIIVRTLPPDHDELKES